MIIGALNLRLSIPEAQSLKDKRRAIRSLKDRLAARHNVSVAEVDDQDCHQSCTLAVVMVANDRRFVASCLDKIVDEVRRHHPVTLMDYEVEWL